jgi:hypothetical protein
LPERKEQLREEAGMWLTFACAKEAHGVGGRFQNIYRGGQCLQAFDC